MRTSPVQHTRRPHPLSKYCPFPAPPPYLEQGNPHDVLDLYFTPNRVFLCPSDQLHNPWKLLISTWSWISWKLNLVRACESYDPKSRLCHYAADIERLSVVFAGKTTDLISKIELSTNIEVFDHYLEQWKKVTAAGDLPRGMYTGGCALHQVVTYTYTEDMMDISSRCPL